MLTQECRCDNVHDITIPVLLIGFNRPLCIRKVMQQLAKVQPSKLYVTIDAPRKDNPDDVALVEDVKAIVRDVKWSCEVHYHFHEHNVGAENNVSKGISWVLENEDMVIVNEDDIYAPYSFYRFVQDMLLMYKDDERIAMVSGINHTVMPGSPANSYYFTKMGHIWGWGTWKRVWDKYDLNEDVRIEDLSPAYFKGLCADDKIAAYEANIFRHWLKPENRTWDFMFSYFRLKNNLLSIVPTRNLVSNIGVDGLHTTNISLCHFYKTDEAFIAGDVKTDVKWNKDYDIYHFDTFICPCKVRRFYNRMRLYLLKRLKYNERFIKSFFAVENEEKN